VLIKVFQFKQCHQNVVTSNIAINLLCDRRNGHTKLVEGAEHTIWPLASVRIFTGEETVPIEFPENITPPLDDTRYRARFVDAFLGGEEKNWKEEKWYDMDLEIEAQDHLTIEARGEAWYLKEEANSKSGPDGHPYNCGEQKCGALIARIGNNDPFPVGASYDAKPHQSGRLILSYQDSYYGDNFGGYDVEVWVRK
jgi:hypothetical protein